MSIKSEDKLDYIKFTDINSFRLLLESISKLKNYINSPNIKNIWDNIFDTDSFA